MSATDTAVPATTEPSDPWVSGPSPSGTAAVSLTHRFSTVAAATGLFGLAFAVWPGIVEFPAAGAVSVAASVVLLGAIFVAAAAKTRRAIGAVDWTILGVALALLAARALTAVFANPGYGTDEAAFVQYAANLVLHGRDPYGANLMPALNRYGVPIQYATYLTNGGTAHTLGYPAWAVVATIPFIWLTGGVQSVVVADLACALSGMVVAFLVLPRRWRSLAVVGVAGFFSTIPGLALGGDISIFVFPFLLLVVWRWTQVGEGGRFGWREWVGATALGVAVATNQIAWFIAPFVVLGIFICRRRELGAREAAGVVARYLGVAVGVFVAINIVFVVEGPLVWLAGVLGPLTQHAIPLGQGLIDLATFAGVGGGHLSYYTDATLLAYLGMLGLFAWRFDRVWRGALVFPSIALWLSTRSLSEYWEPLIVMWLVALAVTHPPEPRQDRSTARRPPTWALAGLGLPALAVIGLAVATPGPLTMRIVSVTTNGQMGSVWKIRARVDNRSGRRLAPHYATGSNGPVTSFWRVVSGPATLAAHSISTVTLEAPNVDSMPGISSRFQLEAVTAQPETVSVAAPYTAEPYVLRLSTTSFPATPLGRPVHLNVQVRSDLGASIHKAGVPIFLGQVIYGQNNLVPSEASINGRPQGQSPVEALTNAEGVADFSIVESTQQNSPLYFQAWTTSPGGYPFGYSQIVSGTWTGSGR